MRRRRSESGVLRRRLAAMRAVDGESGQALVMALIVVLMLGLLPVVAFATLRAVTPAVNDSVGYDTALAAAQAGLQEYRTLLDSYSDYYRWSGADEPPSSEGGCNPAFTGATGSCTTSWVPVSSGPSNREWFEYTPNASQLDTSNSGAQYPGELILTVIGRAGSGSGAVYRRIVATLELSGALQDVYFSTFEQPNWTDYLQWENTYERGNLQTSGSHEFDEANVTVNTAPAGDPAQGEPYAQALCQYDAWQENTFVDWYSTNVQAVYPPAGYPDRSQPYSATNPYFGPWYGTWPDPSGSGYTFGKAVGSQGACPVNYWVTGDSFNGPVYSHDELTTCGDPTFTSLSTAAPENFSGFPPGWPGTHNGRPYGWVQDPFRQCSAPDAPTVGSISFNVDQSLPPIADEIKQEILDDQLLGCVFTGPTAIRFYYNPSTESETMYVWSPLTKNPEASTYLGQTAACGQNEMGTVTFDGSQIDSLCGGTACTGSNTQVSSSGAVQTDQITEVDNVPPDEVIWVQNTPLTTSGLTDQAERDNAWPILPTAESSAPDRGCIDPWVQQNEAIIPANCTEGDLMVGGATNGGLNMGSEANIVLARSLVYSCGLSGSGSNPAFTSSISGCGSSTDITGLIADQSVWMSDPTSGSQCTDNYDMSSPSWSDMVPDTCWVSNPVIDGAVAALQGFFEVQNWRNVGAHGTLTLNGSQEVLTAGQYGVFNPGPPLSVQNGYYLSLNYDHRLLYQPPPGYVQAIGAVWEIQNWISCSSSPNPTVVNPAVCSELRS
ncbi:MAG TPA: hypothetical protein VKU92_07170 [Acidimicrobiales bacterium]|nr:hypothetical protein [Acidimicrobiales bacterium]